MWTVGHDDTNGNRVDVGWFLLKGDAVDALRGFNWHYSVEWDPTAKIVPS